MSLKRCSNTSIRVQTPSPSPPHPPPPQKKIKEQPIIITYSVINKLDYCKSIKNEKYNDCVRRRRTHPNREKLELLWTIRRWQFGPPPENFSGANDVSAMPCASAPRASLSLRVSCRAHSTNR